MDAPAEDTHYSDKNYPVLFHIGDILTVALSEPLALSELPKLPNGNTPPSTREPAMLPSEHQPTESHFALYGSRDILEHMTAGKQGLDTHDRTEAKKALLEQLPWIKGIRPPVLSDGSPIGRAN